MLQPNAFIFAASIATASTSAQSPVRPTPITPALAICDAYGELEVIFVGVAEAPVTYRISGDAEIEKARQTLINVEAEVAYLRATADPRTRWEREREFQLRLVEAHEQLEVTRIKYPPAYDLTIFPLRVERAFRGVTEPRLMVHLPVASMRMEPGERYLISGNRSKDLILPFPEIERLLPFTEYVELHVREVNVEDQELQFLASTAGGGTIVGDLRRHSYRDGSGAPLPGVRILISSETQSTETVTGKDGSFMVSGLQAGRVAVRPLLSNDLTVVNRSALTFNLREGRCRPLPLTVDLNGRVRGRLLGVTGTSLHRVELALWQERMPVDGNVSVNTHSPRLTMRPNEDGTFEFSGVPPGSYLLTARFERSENGKTRYLTSFFPGTTDRVAAVRIDVGRATEHDVFDFLVIID